MARIISMALMDCICAGDFTQCRKQFLGTLNGISCHMVENVQYDATLDEKKRIALESGVAVRN